MSLKDLLQAAADKGDQIYSLIGVVKSIDKAKRTCTVEPTNGGASYYEVRLQCNESAKIGIVSFPKVGSEVLITFLNKDLAYVALASEIESVTYTIDKQEVVFDKKGLHLQSDKSDIKSEIDNLCDTIDKLCDTLINFKLSTNAGVTIAVLPNIVLKLNEYKTDIKGIKKNIGTFLQ